MVWIGARLAAVARQRCAVAPRGRQSAGACGRWTGQPAGKVGRVNQRSAATGGPDRRARSRPTGLGCLLACLLPPAPNGSGNGDGGGQDSQAGFVLYRVALRGFPWAMAGERPPLFGVVPLAPLDLSILPCRLFGIVPLAPFLGLELLFFAPLFFALLLCQSQPHSQGRAAADGGQRQKQEQGTGTGRSKGADERTGARAAVRAAPARQPARASRGREGLLVSCRAKDGRSSMWRAARAALPLPSWRRAGHAGSGEEQRRRRRYRGRGWAAPAPQRGARTERRVIIIIHTCVNGVEVVVAAAAAVVVVRATRRDEAGNCASRTCPETLQRRGR